MLFRVGNQIEVIEPNGEFLRWCHNEMTISNPDYEKKVRMGLWTGNTPERFYLYEENAGRFYLPFGCIFPLCRMFPPSQYKYTSRIKPPETFECESNIRLYGYQDFAVKAAERARSGIIVMPCGSGKTQVALDLISRLKVKTLWLTHTTDLLNQSFNRAKSVLTCDKSSYGTITSGKVNIGSGITFATVQTMAKLDLPKYRDTWGCVIVDECHKAVGTPTKAMQFYRVLSNLSCRYKFGITATPKRSDGLHKTMFALLGDIVYEVSREAVADTTCRVEVEFCDTGFYPDLNVALSSDGTISYAGIVDNMISDEDRFKIVMDRINSIPDGEPIIVLANRVAYLQKMLKAYRGNGICLSTMGTSKKAKELRKKSIEDLNTGEIGCIFATYQLAKEGLDVPNLRYVVFATPEKDETTVAQAAGRVGRKAEGKEVGKVIDFCDPFGMYVGWKKKRISVYRKLKYVYN